MFNVFKKQPKVEFNIKWAILGVVAVSLFMVAITYISFLESSAYDTVKQVTTASKLLKQDDLEGYDTTSPIRAIDLGDYSKKIQNKVQDVQDDKDFNQSILSEEKLGY